MPTSTKAKAPSASGIDRYDFTELVGEGGMGSVYRARDRQSGDTVAVKVLNVKLDENPVLRSRFIQEFRAAAKLEHPNIVRAIDLGTVNGVSYLVTEFVDGIDLGRLIEKRGKLSEVEAVRIVTQVAQALHYAHAGRVVHRDVKPDNVLVRRDGVAKLADFGLAKDWDDDQGLTQDAHGLGTPHYMAPEQYRDAKHAGVASDVYSLGATLYTALTGRVPFEGCASLIALSKKVKGDIPSARDLVPAVSRTVDEAVRRAMDPDPRRRPASVLEFFRLLTRPSRPGRPKPGDSGPQPGADRRRAVRVAVTLGANCVIETGLHGGEDGSIEAWPMVLRDVSGHGIGFLLARRFEAGTELTVEFGGGSAARLKARVVRVVPEALGHWLHGCVFDPVPTPEQLTALLQQVTPAAQ
jgi:serine/threonine protein kinase